MEVYYHYTTPQSGLSIINSRVIKKSTKKAKRRDDARYGEGVYLTKMSPSANLYKIAFNNYDGMSQDAIRRIIDSGKVDAYIELHLNPKDVVECEDEDDQRRNIFLYPDKDLRITDAMKPVLGLTGH